MASSIHEFNPSESPNYRFVVPEAPSRYMRAFLAYVDAIEAWNFDDVMACFDESLEHRILPQSLGRPVLNKRQYGEYFKGITPLFSRKGFKVTLHEIIEADNKMTIHASSAGESATGTSYANEYTSILHFVPLPPNADDLDPLPKIRLIKEFVDSAVSVKFFSEERAKAKEGKEREQRAQRERRRT